MDGSSNPEMVGSSASSASSARRRPPPASDPLHITEFASARYFEKISQSRSSTQREEQVAGSVSQPPWQFILPIRGSSDEPSRPAEQKRSEKTEKSRFFGFRKSHGKATSTTVIQAEEASSSQGESSRQRSSFNQLFECLPTELQVQIISSLPLSDILKLRLTSRSFHALISFNEAPIVRYHLRHSVPAYAKRLYPPPEGPALNFHYFCGIWHRLHVAAKLSDLMCEWSTKEIFLRTTAEKRAEFAPQRERMRRRLIPLLFTVFHFFEAYREGHLRFIAEHNGLGLLKHPYTMNPVEANIMAMYDDRTLLGVHQVFPLVMSSFCRRLRPPSYVGRVEGTLRGYLRERPTDEVHVAILCLGGLRQVERLWEVKGYNSRRSAVDSWYESITRTLSTEPEAKKRRGMLGLGRRKSSAAAGKTLATESLLLHRTSPNNSASADSLVFNTSLAAGMPMHSITDDQLKALLPDLPVLQKIWLETAEAVILDRKIVERPADIKRNAQVLLELIHEDGMQEEDQWWYGTMAPESVRPNLEAVQEDNEDLAIRQQPWGTIDEGQPNPT